jgi:hypothetical protein
MRAFASTSQRCSISSTTARHGFLIYDRTDLHPVMELAGDHADCLPT